jgi:hypothetical protein
MFAVDLTAQLAPIIWGLEMILVLAVAAILLSRRSPFTGSQNKGPVRSKAMADFQSRRPVISTTAEVRSLAGG